MSDSNANTLRSAAEDIVRRLQEAGFIAYWAGGCVRDLLRQVPPNDYDVATSARPDDILRLFPDANLVGRAFGVVRVRWNGHECEVATFREDHGYADGRHPDSVSFSGPEMDARRRDFTVNALFYDPVADRIHDFVGGQSDLAARVVRAVGEPERRFREDHLRMLRAARFTATLQFTLEPRTAEAIRKNAGLLGRVSAERICGELARILLESPAPGEALVLMDGLRLLEVILPEVAAMKGQPQPPAFHPEGDVFQHTVLMLNAMQERSLRLAFAVLLHDAGKPGTARECDDRIRFDGHAERGAEIARCVLERLRFPSDDTEAVSFCIGNHMRFMEVQNMRPATLRRLVGAPTFAVELELHRLDCLASHRDLENYNFLLRFLEELKNEPVLPKPWITGRDIMALGVPQGPEVGSWRRKAYEAQIEGQFADRTGLLEWLRREISRRG